MRLVVVATLVLAIGAQPCFGGGSDELVSIEKFQVLNSTDYVLVVLPKPLAGVPPDWFMGGCAKFTVHGTYRRFRNREDEVHLSALRFLKDAFDRHMVIRLGWIGRGFEPADRNDRCIVKSRALELYTDERGPAVYSRGFKEP
jgi:hypothetical protein